MTAPRAAGRALAGPPVHTVHSASKVLAAKLREAAGREVAFSSTKLLLLEAASMIERLDRESLDPPVGEPIQTLKA